MRVKSGLVKKEAIPQARRADAGVSPSTCGARNSRTCACATRSTSLRFRGGEQEPVLRPLSRASTATFDNSELQRDGLAGGPRARDPEEVKAEVPPEVFTTEWKNPVNARLRERCAYATCGEAVEAACEARAGRLQGRRAAQRRRASRSTVEFLLGAARFRADRAALHARTSRSSASRRRLRIVDSAQYKRRVDELRLRHGRRHFGQSHSPGNEQRDFWGSAGRRPARAAATPSASRTRRSTS